MRISDCGFRNKRLAVAVLLVLVGSGYAFTAQDQTLPQKLAALEKLGPKFSFVVLGDNRAGDPASDAVYERLLTAVSERKPDLIVNTGDEVDKPGHSGNWKRFQELSKNVTAPYFLTVGNHDIHPAVAGSEDVYREQVDLPGNELYYSFVAGNALFVVLDSSVKGEEKKVTGEQYAWLEKVLASSKEKHKFIFVHHPLFPEQGKGKHHGNSLDRYKDERDKLHRLFVKEKVTAVFAGHEHLYLRKSVDGIIYVITGGGGAPLYGKDEEGGFHHFVRMTVDGTSVTGEVVDVDGKSRDRF